MVTKNCCQWGMAQWPWIRYWLRSLDVKRHSINTSYSGNIVGKISQTSSWNYLGGLQYSNVKNGSLWNCDTPLKYHRITVQCTILFGVNRKMAPHHLPGSTIHFKNHKIFGEWRSGRRWHGGRGNGGRGYLCTAYHIVNISHWKHQIIRNVDLEMCGRCKHLSIVPCRRFIIFRGENTSSRGVDTFHCNSIRSLNPD